MRTISVFALLLGTSFLIGCGGGDGSSCSAACDKIFKECKLSSFHTPGGTATASSCVSICEGGKKQSSDAVNEILACVEATSCNEMSTCE